MPSSSSRSLPLKRATPLLISGFLMMSCAQVKSSTGDGGDGGAASSRRTGASGGEAGCHDGYWEASGQQFDWQGSGWSPKEKWVWIPANCAPDGGQAP